MTKVYVLHYSRRGRLPKLSKEEEKEFKKSIEAHVRKKKGVRYNGTMYDPKTGIGVCNYEAPSKDIVNKVLAALNIPHDDIVKVKQLDWGPHGKGPEK